MGMENEDPLIVLIGRSIDPLGRIPFFVPSLDPAHITKGTRALARKSYSVSVALQSLAKRLATGLVNFDPAVAYHFCLALPTAFTQPGTPFT